jgi:multiple sugar transport system ATP-binding protein
MARVTLSKVCKRYGDVEAVRDVNLEIPDKELVVLVGPSGCGKSTTLRMIAGLEEISAGEIRIGDRVVNDVAPKDRDIAMVFQSYALYPHMSVRQNLEFGLRMRGTPRPEIDTRVREAAAILGIEGLLDRKPKQLSGGQRQRVAMGRAIVRRPAVFLFDEPLSNLDAKLRVQMRTEIARLHSRLQTTTVYVTHDQTEAMTLADRIVVMKDGVVQQLGAPLELYDRPANLFVAGFIGTPAMNFVEGEIAGSEGGEVVFQAEGIRVAAPPAAKGKVTVGQRVVLGVRPPDLALLDDAGARQDASTGMIPARVDVREPMGSEVYLHLDRPFAGWVVRVDGHSPTREGDQVSLALRQGAVHLFDRGTERSLLA